MRHMLYIDEDWLGILGHMSPGTACRIGPYCQVILVNFYPVFICVEHVSYHGIGGEKFQHILCKTILSYPFLALWWYFAQSVCVATPVSTLCSPVNVLDTPCHHGIGG